MTLYDDAYTEFGTRNGNLSISWNGGTYSPYTFMNNVLMAQIYMDAQFETAASTRAFFIPDTDPPDTMNITNTDIIAAFRASYLAIQKLKDGYAYIRSQIAGGQITTSGQIPTAWDSYNSTYVNPRVQTSSIETLQNAFIRSPSTVNRTLDSAYQISSTRDAFVSYTVKISLTLSLVTPQEGTVFLQYADDSGFTQNVKTLCGPGWGFATGLTLAVSSTPTLSGFIPAAKYVKLVTEKTSGASPTFTYKYGQETLI